MRFRSAQPQWLWGAVVMSALVSAGCGDDTVSTTGTESDAGSGTESTSSTTEDPSTTDVLPTTTTPLPTTTDDTSSTSTTDAITSSTTDDSTTTTIGTETDPSTSSSSSTSTGPDTDTDTDTDTTTGDPLQGKTQSQFVNAGNVATSRNFRMVFTLGQPTTNQGTYDSPNFTLRGGLIGANGSPP